MACVFLELANLKDQMWFYLNILLPTYSVIRTVGGDGAYATAACRQSSSYILLTAFKLVMI